VADSDGKVLPGKTQLDENAPDYVAPRPDDARIDPSLGVEGSQGNGGYYAANVSVEEDKPLSQTQSQNEYPNPSK
jgi:hypothetical protein